MRTITPNIEMVVDAKNTMGETPFWSAAESVLYWVNCDHPAELLRWDPKTKDVKRWPMPERIGGFVLKQGGNAMVILASGLFDFDFASAKLTKRVASPLDPTQVALHEGACDPSGRFWVGSIDLRVRPDNPHPGGGKFFRLDGDKLTPVIDNISCANGLAFTPDGRYMYVTDSTTRRCDRYDLNIKTGEISNRHTFFQLGPNEGYIDGAAMDMEGGYWCPTVYAGAIRRYLPDGTCDVEVRLPFENATKVSFGGDKWDTIYITSTPEGLTPTPSPLNGGVFAYKPGVIGKPETLLPA